MKSFYRLNSALLVLLLLICCSCASSNIAAPPPEDAALSGINTAQKMSANSMLTNMPLFCDDKVIFYAKKSKQLCMINEDNTSIIDQCSEDELITDIYAEHNYVYYAKQNHDTVNVIRADKNIFNKRETVFDITHSGVSSGCDFIYVKDGIVYYYNSVDYELYCYNDGILSKLPHESVTSAYIDDEYIYYADNSAIYKCDKNFNNTQKLWDLNSLAECKDEFISQWYHTNITFASVIKNISRVDDKIMFLVFSMDGLNNGLMAELEDDGTFDVYTAGNVSTYQLYNDEICAGGLYTYEQNQYKGVFRINKQKDVFPIPIEAIKKIYVYDDGIYFASEESEGLSKINVKTEQITVIE